MSTFMFWLAMVVVLLGVLGTVIPFLPGTTLIFAAALGYGVYEGFHKITPLVLAILFIMMALTFLIDYLAGVVGAKKYGATKYGTWGALAGGIVGAITLGIIGLLIGPFIGAVAGEMISGRNFSEGVKVGFGTVVGIAGGAFVKLVFALAMAAVYLTSVI